MEVEANRNNSDYKFDFKSGVHFFRTIPTAVYLIKMQSALAGRSPGGDMAWVPKDILNGHPFRAFAEPVGSAGSKLFTCRPSLSEECFTLFGKGI